MGRPPRPRPPGRPCHQGPACAGVTLRPAERRQQRLRDLQAKRELLCVELAETQGRLMVRPGRWLQQCESRPEPLCPP